MQRCPSSAVGRRVAAEAVPQKSTVSRSLIKNNMKIQMAEFFLFFLFPPSYVPNRLPKVFPVLAARDPGRKCLWRLVRSEVWRGLGQRIQVEVLHDADSWFKQG